MAKAAKHLVWKTIIGWKEEWYSGLKLRGNYWKLSLFSVTKLQDGTKQTWDPSLILLRNIAFRLCGTSCLWDKFFNEVTDACQWKPFEFFWTIGVVAVSLNFTLTIKALIISLFFRQTSNFQIWHLSSQTVAVGCGISCLTCPSSPDDREIPKKKHKMRKVDCYQLCRPLPQSGSDIRISLVPENFELNYQNFGCSLTCWEWSSSFCSQRSIHRAPFPALAGAPGRWWSGRLATCPCLEYLYLSISIWVLVFEY